MVILRFLFTIKAENRQGMRIACLYSAYWLISIIFFTLSTLETIPSFPYFSGVYAAIIVAPTHLIIGTLLFFPVIVVYIFTGFEPAYHGNQPIISIRFIIIMIILIVIVLIWITKVEIRKEVS
ncbi:hypothetical protein [Neobacillus niacini]|uniref:hypothetical protein n=1 Tax=Neobacillus niacini TaxID=86668 RepID=UPI001C8F0ABD|nr:hypothetical protein [Neobacillus niacini]MBY0145925.1 hypothetical protein [Neobacillus niacini]